MNCKLLFSFLIQVDQSVLEALPGDIRKQIEQSWRQREEQPSTSSHLSTPPRTSSSPPPGPSLGTLVLQFPNQPGQPCTTGIILELPDFSQVHAMNIPTTGGKHGELVLQWPSETSILDILTWTFNRLTQMCLQLFPESFRKSCALLIETRETLKPMFKLKAALVSKN